MVWAIQNKTPGKHFGRLYGFDNFNNYCQNWGMPFRIGITFTTRREARECLKVAKQKFPDKKYHIIKLEQTVKTTKG